eukprot:m.174301 g.174301  ORF g.174301 m.174301 type:complete len:295 (-) comp31763_c4_seq1:108-992(-)
MSMSMISGGKSNGKRAAEDLMDSFRNALAPAAKQPRKANQTSASQPAQFVGILEQGDEPVQQDTGIDIQIRGEGTSLSDMVEAYMQLNVLDHLRSTPQVFVSEEDVLKTTGCLSYRNKEVFRLRQLLRQHQQLHFKVAGGAPMMSFIPKYNGVRNKDSIITELKKRYLEAKPGMTVEFLKESYPGVMADVDELVKAKQIYALRQPKRTNRGKEMLDSDPLEDSAQLFYRDTTLELEVNSDMVSKWRECRVHGMHAQDIVRWLKDKELPVMKTQEVRDDKRKRKRPKRSRLGIRR